MKPTVETNDPIFLTEGGIGRDVASPTFTGITNIGVELTPENLLDLTAGKTIRVHASPNLVIQITVFGGQVDTVRDSIAAAKVADARRE